MHKYVSGDLHAPPFNSETVFNDCLVNVLYRSIVLVHQWSQRVYVLDYSYNGKRHAGFVLAKSEVSVSRGLDCTSSG